MFKKITKELIPEPYICICMFILNHHLKDYTGKSHQILSQKSNVLRFHNLSTLISAY